MGPRFAVEAVAAGFADFCAVGGAFFVDGGGSLDAGGSLESGGSVEIFAFFAGASGALAGVRLNLRGSLRGSKVFIDTEKSKGSSSSAQAGMEEGGKGSENAFQKGRRGDVLLA